MFSTRKILSGLLMLVTGLALVAIKGDVPPNMLSLMQWLYLSFVAGSAAQHATETYAALNQKDKPNV